MRKTKEFRSLFDKQGALRIEQSSLHDESQYGVRQSLGSVFIACHTSGAVHLKRADARRLAKTILALTEATRQPFAPKPPSRTWTTSSHHQPS